MSRWNEKVVLVTGGSAGLGRAIADAFGQQGARLVLASRKEDLLQQAAASFRERGVDVLAVKADATQDEDVERLIGSAIERFGQLDVLVNAVGRSMRGTIASTSTSQFEELLQVNFLTAVRCTRTALPHLLKARGHVVNIGSLAAKTASPHMGAYAASKFPLVAFSQQLRLEYESAGLHTLLVCPGPLKRLDAGSRYDTEAADLPDSARQPGGGAKLASIDPLLLAQRIVRACERRKPELIVPGRARLLFALSQLWPSLGDWLVRRNT
ncbi:MAG: SDR family NAD(P)-dependent oxidoreductase [Planctomycetes bacterium]|nr:SDR family NAD(P)-dependent oxidoreductase [Planctomycetota bacterium]